MLKAAAATGNPGARFEIFTSRIAAAWTHMLPGIKVHVLVHSEKEKWCRHEESHPRQALGDLELFRRREQADSKADFAAIAGAVQTSTRALRACAARTKSNAAIGLRSRRKMVPARGVEPRTY